MIFQIDYNFQKIFIKNILLVQVLLKNLAICV